MTNISNTKRILFLWATLTDYTMSCFRELAKRKDIELYIIYRSGDADAPYDPFDLSFFHDEFVYSKHREKELTDFCCKLNPDVIIMASWNFPFYMSVARKCKRNGTYVVSAFDNQWRATPKQLLGVLTSPFFLKPAIHNFFVSGDRQVTFAKKLGYKNPFIGYCCANTDRYYTGVGEKEKKFIFAGRLVDYKGVGILMKAYRKYRESVSDPWGLVICGMGELEPLCENQEGVEFNGFLQPAALAKKLNEAQCLILPSTFEPWGMVIHEAALSGLAIISSADCGASTFFVRDGENGYIINPDVPSLCHAMKLVSTAGADMLKQMSATSRILGSLWTNEKWSAYVYENICLKKISPRLQSIPEYSIQAARI